MQTPRDMQALIYTQGGLDDETVVKFLLQSGYLCEALSDIKQLDADIELYNPSLIFAVDSRLSAAEYSIPGHISLYTSKQTLLRRLTLQALKLDDQQWHELLCSVDQRNLSLLLWYVADANLLKTLLNRLTLRTGQQLMEDLEKNFASLTHSSASDETVNAAEIAMFEIIHLCQSIKKRSLGVNSDDK